MKKVLFSVLTLALILLTINSASAYTFDWGISTGEVFSNYQSIWGNSDYSYRFDDRYAFGINRNYYEYNDNYINYQRVHRNGYGRYNDFDDRFGNRFLPTQNGYSWNYKTTNEARVVQNSGFYATSNNGLDLNRPGTYVYSQKIRDSGMGYNSRPYYTDITNVYNVKKSNPFWN